LACCPDLGFFGTWGLETPYVVSYSFRLEPLSPTLSLAVGGGRTLTPPPERWIHPATPVPLSHPPDESGVPVRLLGCSGAGLQMRPARLCASGYRGHGLIHHRRSRQAARPTGRPPTRTPRPANTVAPLDQRLSCKDVASMFLGCSFVVSSFLLPLFVPSCPRSRHPRHVKTRAVQPGLPPSTRAPIRSSRPASRQPTVATANIETAAASSRLQ
jgi:hypothetical protein